MQGTLPFMAIKILFEGIKMPHCPTHDLESLFYILIWVCAMYEGPRNQERAFDNRDNPPLSSWYDNNADGLGFNADAKSRHCLSLKQFNARILNYFHPYFDDLKECCHTLWCLFFSDVGREARAVISHDDMCKILQ